MATAIAPKAGTDRDARLIKNRPLNPRQLASLKKAADSEAGITPSELGASKLFRDDLYSVDKARRTLNQLVTRGCVKHLANGAYKATAKGKKIAGA